MKISKRVVSRLNRELEKDLNLLNIKLEIDIDTYTCGNLLNKFVEDGVKPKSIRLKINNLMRYKNKNDEKSNEGFYLEDLKIDGLEYFETHIELFTINIYDNCFKTYCNKDGFNLVDILHCIEDYEKTFRPTRSWFGGIDAHHIYLESVWFVLRYSETFKCDELFLNYGWGS